MPDVPILVFEDSPLDESIELRKLVNLPRRVSAGGQDYLFNWHSVYNALGGLTNKEPVLIRSIEAYRDAASFLRNQLSGEAIIFIDLQLFEPSSFGRASKLFNLDRNDITDDVLTFAACLDVRVHGIETFLEYFNPERIGVLLALSAAQNSRWQGMGVFASGRNDIDINQFLPCVKTGDRILWRNLGASLSIGSSPKNRADKINHIIDEFLERRMGAPFWPTNTENWFKSMGSIPPHDPPKPPDSDQTTVNLVKEYLNQLLGEFIPPESWFQLPQWLTLYEVLKGLIGFYSVSASNTVDNPKNMRLATIPLLLAAQMAWKKKNIDWLKSFVWSADDERDVLVEIMEHQNKIEAQNAIRAMAVFLEHLSLGEDESSQVIGASWGKVADDKAVHLFIDFKIDPLSGATGRSLLQTIFGSRWGNGKGQTVAAYEKMMELSREQGTSSGPIFSLCIYPVANDENQLITRLDFRAIG